MLNVLPVSMEQEEEEVSYVDIPQHEGVVHDTVWSKNGQNHAIMSVSSSEAE
jgi:selenocysteine-specific translation elongation factor